VRGGSDAGSASAALVGGHFRRQRARFRNASCGAGLGLHGLCRGTRHTGARIACTAGCGTRVCSARARITGHVDASAAASSRRDTAARTRARTTKAATYTHCTARTGTRAATCTRNAITQREASVGAIVSEADTAAVRL
jgi:hypothetical protein